MHRSLTQRTRIGARAFVALLLFVAAAALAVADGPAHAARLSAAGAAKPTGRLDRLQRRARRGPALAGLKVAAGRNRRVVVGDVVPLVGHVTEKSGPRPSVRWRLLKRDLSPTEVRTAGLKDPTQVDADFKAAVPGEYTLRLTAGTGASAKSESVTLTVVPRSPLVTVKTMVRTADGQPAIQVGGQTYVAPLPKGTHNALVQVLVLDRQSLGLVSNTTYTLAGELQFDLQKLDSSQLVIASLQTPQTPGPDPVAGSLASALASIGFPTDVQVQPKAGTLSVIGVPGSKPGTASINVDPRGADMSGYLTPDRNQEYGYVSSQLVPFDEGKLGAGCGPTGNCNDVGFSVSDIDPYTLDEHKSLFVTNGRNESNLTHSERVGEMAQYLDKIPDGDLVTINTVSNRIAGEATFRPPIGLVDRDSMDLLDAAVARVGGTRNGFNLEVRKAGPASGAPVYTLVGWAGAGQGNGDEAALGVDGTGDSPQLQGMLRRDNRHQFRPVQASPTAPPADGLEQLVLQQPKDDWPLENDPGAMRAFAYLGSQDKHLGSDPRSAYWLEPYNEATWDAIDLNIHDVNYPTGSNPEFTQAQFDAAKAELVKELGWVSNVRGYLAEISSVFSDNALKSWADAHTIADEIYADSQKPSGNAGLRWSQFVSILLKNLAPFVAPELSMVANLLDMGNWIAGGIVNGSQAGNDPDVAADQLGSKLIDQTQQAQATYLNMGSIIAGDYEKLKYVGTNGGCNPGPGCPEEYSYTVQDQASAAAAYNRAFDSMLYQKLMPLGYWVFELNRYPDNRDQFYADTYGYPHNNGTDPPALGRYDCEIWNFHPWYDWPKMASTTLLNILSPDNLANNQWLVYTVAVPPGADAHGTPPPDSLLKRMFDPVPDTNDPNEGGLGISFDTFVLHSKLYGWRSFPQPGADDGCVWQLP
jgi:hypothetical protein